MLNDEDIRNRVSQQKMLENSDPIQIVNCAYTLRVGAIFEPKSGIKEVRPPRVKGGGERLLWTIGPTECLVVMTKEVMNIPEDICAYYHPLQRLAAQGLLLINASIIEPGYRGPLSCFLVNFSSQDVVIAAEQEIAKITFHKLNAAPTSLKAMEKRTADYEIGLSQSARIFEKSFLGIKSIQNRAAESAKKQIKKSVIAGGIIVGFLIIFAQLEPFFSRWIWEKSGIMTVSYRTEQEKLLKDIEAAGNKFGYLTERTKSDIKIRELEDKLSKLQKKIDAQKSNKRAD